MKMANNWVLLTILITRNCAAFGKLIKTPILICCQQKNSPASRF